MDQFKTRRLWVMGIFLLVFIAYGIKLLSLQVFNASYKKLADQNVVRKMRIYPNRGLVYDRNGKLIIYNDAVYDLYVIPKVAKGIDTLKLCDLLGISRPYFDKKMAEAKKYSPYKPFVFLKQISAEDYARFQEFLYLFKGFFGQIRTIRKYPYKAAGHLLGDIGEVSQSELDKNPYYKQGDYIGISGIEKVYEEVLRGYQGTKLVLVDVYNREQGAFMDSRLDTQAVSGRNIKTSIDVELQLYGEQLMKGKKGAIVAIEPSTGEILALISFPGYDPNLLTGRKRGENFLKLSTDSLKPLFNRALSSAQNPPGSTFKPVMALIGLQEGTLHPYDGYPCYMGYIMGSLTIGCRAHPYAGSLSMGIQQSCNAYFCNVFRNIFDQKKFKSSDEALEKLVNYWSKFGLGKKIGVDLPNEVKGTIPTPAYYNRYYTEGRWRSSTIISLAIGQGEIGVTPFQMANMVSVIANRGYYVIPHVAVDIEGESADSLLLKFKERHYTGIDTAYFNAVADAMFMTVEQGTARASRIPDISMCGKTGTSQNPHGEDNSLFIGFAPLHNPKIAIAALVENAGGGSKYAAPISSLIIEKYLNDTISRLRKPLEERMINTNFINPPEDELE